MVTYPITEGSDSIIISSNQEYIKVFESLENYKHSNLQWMLNNLLYDVLF